MMIYVDADACPVKDVIIFEATNAEIPVTLVTSFSHYSNAEQPKGVETIYVDSGADAADYRIMQLAQKEDLIITQNVPKGNFNRTEYTKFEISTNSLVELRQFVQKKAS